jgi:hypothetical protein
MSAPKSHPKTTKVFSFLTRARSCYSSLGIEAQGDDKFMQLLGLNKKSYKNWYSHGIKPIYKTILDFIEENKALKEENKALKDEKHQKQL